MRISFAVLLVCIGIINAQERSISGGGSRRNQFSAGKSQSIGFNCPEDFGYYAHPSDCSQYYVCVFGGALLESCTGGLMYSNELQTCDWPRNVVCKDISGPGISTVKVTDPRTSVRGGNQVLSATESLATSSLKRPDNSIRSREPLKSSGTSKSVFDESSKLRQGRFILGQESTNQNFNTGFQAQETSSRAFNVVAASPSPKFVFPPLLPGVSSTNRFAAPTAAPAVAPVRATPAVGQSSFYNDLLNLNDTDYYYYYDDILYDDYYEPTTKTTTPKPRQSSRSRGNSPDLANSVNVAPTVSNKGRGSSSRPSSPSSSISSDSSFNSSPSSSFLGTFSSPPARAAAVRTGGETTSSVKQPKKSASKSSSSTRGSSSQSSAKASASGSPELVGKGPQRLVRPSKKPPPVSTRGSLITDIWKYPPRRPAPVYPQPQVDTPATPCDPAVCRLPDCYCGKSPVPGNIPPQNVPQMVLLTFDDSVNDLNKKLYIDLFEKGRVNPNGCPIAATYYVSHEWTDYSQVQNLYSDGHEIASHSVTHSFGEKFSTEKWAKEIGGQREIMSAYGGVRMEDIRGMRAPFLAVGGNNMFRMLYDLNFTYDSSMPVYENRPPSWPYTLDYKIFHDCMIPPCPTNSYPGVWSVPMVMWQDLTGGRCSMGDACTTPGDAEGVYKFLIKNFERHYTTNRSPLGLYYHAAWFTTPHHKEGFIAFLDTITAMDDVWLVTSWQSLEWVRNPVPLSQAKSFKPFQCDYPERPPRCTSPKVCNVWHKGSVRYMKTCQQCPDSYPWVGNTGVQSPLNDVV